MWIKNLFKIILLFLSGISTLILLFLLTSYFFFQNNNIFIYEDNNKYLTKLISWYFNEDIILNSIKVSKNKFDDKYNIIVNNIELNNFKNVVNSNIERISFDCMFLSCFKGYKNYQNINLINPIIEIKYLDSQKKNINHKFLEDMIYGSNISKIVDGSIKLTDSNITREIKNINATLNDDNTLVANLSFKFKGPEITKIDFEILKNKNKTNILIAFKKLYLSDFSNDIFSLIPIKNNNILIDGNINLLAKNQKFTVAYFNLYSKAGYFFLDENYINSSYIEYAYKYKNLSLLGYYDFSNSQINYNDIELTLLNDKNLYINIFINGYIDKELNNFLNVNFNISDYVPQTISIFKSKKINNMFIQKYSGEGSFKIINNIIEDLELNLNDFSINKINLHNLFFKSKSLQSDIYVQFELNGDVRDIIPFMKENNLINIKQQNLIDGHLSAEVNLFISDYFQPIEKTKFDIKGSLNKFNIKNVSNKYIFDADNKPSLIFDIDNHNEDQNIIVNSIKFVFDKGFSKNELLEFTGQYKFKDDTHNLLGNFNFINLYLNNIKSIIPYDNENILSLRVNGETRIDYNFNFKKNIIYLSADANLLNTKLKLIYIKNNETDKISINFLLNNNIRKILKFNQNIIDGNSNYIIELNKNNDDWNMDIKIDYLDSVISIPSIKYYKPMGNEAYLLIIGKLESKFSFNDIEFHYSDMNNIVEGNINEINNKSIDLTLSKFSYDKNDLIANINYIYKNSIDIKILEGVFNFDTFYNANKSYNNNDIFIIGNLDKFIISDDIFLNHSEFNFIHESGKLKQFSVKGKYYGDEDLIFHSENDANKQSRNKYSLIATDAGKFFKTLKYNTEIQGGLLTSEGFYGDLDEQYEIMGTISIDSFKLMKTPIFAELLLAASLTGLIELLENDGIEFEQFDAQFFGKNKIYNIVKSRAYGFSLGVTGKGIVDSNNKILDIKGALIPAYKINSVFNNIPIIGELIVGKEDEGLFAINYNTKGKWNNLEYEINPISLLTPGLLRNIFDFLE